jgi:uncharacterized SAM-binding protein YcdF (DUF218 family)
MYDIVVGLLQPYRLLFLLLGLAVLRLWWQRRTGPRGLILLTMVFAGLTAISIPGVAHVALGSLEWQYERVERRPREAQAIVVLTSSMWLVDPEGHRVELDADSVARCQHAVELYCQGPPCPVVVSGGKVDPDVPGPTTAAVMAEFLRTLGVKPGDLIVEEVSRTTFENAVESGKWLRRRQLDNVLLVTDAVDMMRALRCFHKQGIAAIPAPCHYRTSPFRPTLFTFLPSAGAAQHCQRVWHEWLGMAWYWVQGRL